MSIEVDDILKCFTPERKNLIMILHAIQDNSEYGCISNSDVNSLSEFLDLPVAEIDGVISFYSMFSRKKRAKYVIRVCDSIVCRIQHSLSVLDYLQQKLQFDAEHRSRDGLFYLETVNCLGACDKAPNMLINDRLYSGLDREKIDIILESYKV